MTTILRTGEVHSGKSTELMNLCDGKKAYGLINPTDEKGEKQFHLISNDTSFPMNAKLDEPSIEVGKYRFSEAAFERANRELIDEWNCAEGLFIVDEVGKLELAEKGLSPAIHHILSQPNPKVDTIVWVVRDYLLEEASRVFGWESATVIYKEDVALLA